MKQIRPALAVCALALVVAAPAESVHWQTNLAKAEKMAAKLHRVVVVDFYADW